MAKKEVYLHDIENQDLADESTSLLDGTFNEPIRQNSIQSDLHTMTALADMKIRSHKIKRDGSISSCISDEAVLGAKGGKKYYWVDIDAGPENTSELRNWLFGLNLPNFVIEVLATDSDTWASQVIPLPKACLVIIRILPINARSDQMFHVAALSLRNMLITFSSCPRKDTEGLYKQAFQQMNEPGRLPCSNSNGALIAWLRFHLDQTSKATRVMRHHVLKMDESMDRDIHSVHIQEIIDAKDHHLRVLSIAEEQSECLQGLSATSDGIDGSDLSLVRGSLGSLVATAKSSERMALRLEKHIAELRARAEDIKQDNLNRRLGFLTVISAIFLPLTLLTGIWGMNFNSMPELEKPYAYPLALFSMICLASLMLYYFRRSGYFD